MVNDIKWIQLHENSLCRYGSENVQNGEKKKTSQSFGWKSKVFPRQGQRTPGRKFYCTCQRNWGWIWLKLHLFLFKLQQQNYNLSSDQIGFTGHRWPRGDGYSLGKVQIIFILFFFLHFRVMAQTSLFCLRLWHQLDRCQHKLQYVWGAGFVVPWTTSFSLKPG